jgi:pimeloyl-ACP methyl ester carboxylesterase
MPRRKIGVDMSDELPLPEAFDVQVPSSVLDDLRSRLMNTRWPDDPDNETGRFGLRRSYLESFVRTWLDDYDWRQVEAEMNAFPNWRVVLDEQPVHFVHVPGRGPAPVPVVLTHGYPWSAWDYRKVIGPLADPAAHGGDPADAFDVIVPSIPGYGFSTPMRPGGISAKVTAGLWVRLVRDVLGLGSFITAGGDWGSVISIMAGYLYPDDLRGVYVTLPNFAPALRNTFEGFQLDDLYPDEREWYEREWRRGPGPGRPIVRTDRNLFAPQTDAYAGTDSPLALAVEILDGRRRWADTNGDVESAFTRDELITAVMLYWVTGSWASAKRFYWYTARDPIELDPSRTPPVAVPTGIGLFPAEVFYVPRRFVERDANLVHWSPQPAGGHFAACEQPDLFVEDLRAFARKVR